jgi:hypothetical protein
VVEAVGISVNSLVSLSDNNGQIAINGASFVLPVLPYSGSATLVGPAGHHSTAYPTLYPAVRYDP